MKLYMVSQLERDHTAEAQATTVEWQIADWLTARQKPENGLWHNAPLPSPTRLNNTFRGGYHHHPVFEYDRQPLPHTARTINSPALQNEWDAFEEEDHPAGACEDTDALDPLLRRSIRSGDPAGNVRLAAERALVWVLDRRNPDGGSMSIPEYGFHYGYHPLATGRPCESNLFAPWFRTLIVAYLAQVLGLPRSFVILHYPGYEIALPQPNRGQA